MRSNLFGDLIFVAENIANYFQRIVRFGGRFTHGLLIWSPNLPKILKNIVKKRILFDKLFYYVSYFVFIFNIKHMPPLNNLGLDISIL